MLLYTQILAFSAQATTAVQIVLLARHTIRGLPKPFAVLQHELSALLDEISKDCTSQQERLVVPDSSHDASAYREV